MCISGPTASTSNRASIKAKGHLQDIWMAETKADAEDAFDFFARAYGAKYDKAVECLNKDRDRLLTFYDFPAEHWKHVRSTDAMDKRFFTSVVFSISRG
jgi:transposase-like protein